MIGYLSGTIVYSDSQKSILLTASGIGYEVHTSAPLVPGKEISLFTSQIIREQSHDLFGFDTAEDKNFFEMLLDVNGIGPKSAFALISRLGVDQILSAITFENVDILKSAPGVGKKSAEQIVLSLKDKIKKIESGLEAKKRSRNILAKDDKLGYMDPHLVKETLAACQGLGFKDQDVLPLINKHLQGGDVSRPEDLLRLLLKELR